VSKKKLKNAVAFQNGNYTTGGEELRNSFFNNNQKQQNNTKTMAQQFTSFEEYKTTLIESVLKDAEAQWKEIELKNRLLNLHKELGFRSIEDFVAKYEAVINGESAPAPVAKTKGPKQGKTGNKGKKKPAAAAPAAAPADAPAADGAPAADAPVKKAKKVGKAKRARVTPEVVKQIIELRAQGKTAKEVSKALGVSEPTVYKVTKSAGKAA
jgi:hypothetical protein